MAPFPPRTRCVSPLRRARTREVDGLPLRRFGSGVARALRRRGADVDDAVAAAVSMCVEQLYRFEELA
ncbi:hypothetical protein VCV18_011709 [Metarhizium anisopliae]